MGYQTILIVNNDYVHELSKCPELGKEISSVCGGMPRNQEIVHGLEAVVCHHSSGYSIVVSNHCQAKEWHDLNDKEKVNALNVLQYNLPEGIKITGLKKWTQKSKLLEKKSHL